MFFHTMGHTRRVRQPRKRSRSDRRVVPILTPIRPGSVTGSSSDGTCVWQMGAVALPAPSHADGTDVGADDASADDNDLRFANELDKSWKIDPSTDKLVAHRRKSSSVRPRVADKAAVALPVLFLAFERLAACL